MDMSRAPMRPRPAGGRPRHRSKARNRAADESLRGDPCVLSGWLAATSIGDQEGRVHGGRPCSAVAPTATLTRTDGRRSKPITGPRVSPLEQDPDEFLLGDASVHGEWLAAVSLGDEQGQGRVHGGGAMSPFFTVPSPPGRLALILPSDHPFASHVDANVHKFGCETEGNRVLYYSLSIQRRCSFRKFHTHY